MNLTTFYSHVSRVKLNIVKRNTYQKTGYKTTRWIKRSLQHSAKANQLQISYDDKGSKYLLNVIHELCFSLIHELRGREVVICVRGHPQFVLPMHRDRVIIALHLNHGSSIKGFLNWTAWKVSATMSQSAECSAAVVPERYESLPKHDTVWVVTARVLCGHRLYIYR